MRSTPPAATFEACAVSAGTWGWGKSEEKIVCPYVNIASECGVSAPSVKEYFQILEDTLKMPAGITGGIRFEIIRLPRRTLGAGAAYDIAALFPDKPRIVGEGLGAADPDFSEFRMQGIEEKVRFDMNYRTRNGQNGTCF